MRKFTTSKLARMVAIGSILLYNAGFLLFAILYLFYLNQERLKPFDDMYFFAINVLLSGSCLFVVGFMLCWSFTDPLVGKISFDTMGVNFYTPLKSFRFSYNECADIGFTSWYGFGRSKIVFYVYFSKIEISPEQRHFLAARRHKKKRGKRNMPLYQSEFLMFQYTSEIFSEFIECVPSPFREELLKKERELGLKGIEYNSNLLRWR